MVPPSMAGSNVGLARRKRIMDRTAALGNDQWSYQCGPGDGSAKSNRSRAPQAFTDWCDADQRQCGPNNARRLEDGTWHPGGRRSMAVAESNVDLGAGPG